MSWSFSFQLFPGEEVVDDSSRIQHAAVKPAYSVFLTNKRAIFRFDGLGSSLTKSFYYDEILDVRPTKRIFINYLLVRTNGKEHLLNIVDPEYWAEKILSIKKSVGKTSGVVEDMRPVLNEKKKELLDMLVILRKNSVLTENEYEEKVRLVDSLDP